MTLPLASLPVDALRLETPHGYGVLDTPPKEGFDDLVHRAARACAAPVALVSPVDQGRPWFKSRVGLSPVRDRPRQLGVPIRVGRAQHPADTRPDGRPPHA